MTFDNTSEVCSSVKQKIKSIETTLSNRFDGLADQINKFSLKLCETTTDSNELTTIPSNHISVSCKLQHSSISQAVLSVLSEEREKDKRQLNLALYNVHPHIKICVQA